MAAEAKNENVQEQVSGSIKVHESVLAAIARRAVASVPEVLRLSGSSFIDNIAEMVNSRKTFDKSMVIEIEDDVVSIEVRIIAKYGVFLPNVASAVQKAIVSDITRGTGMKLGKVNVVVMDVDEDNALPLEEQEQPE